MNTSPHNCEVNSLQKFLILICLYVTLSR